MEYVENGKSYIKEVEYKPLGYSLSSSQTFVEICRDKIFVI